MESVESLGRRLALLTEALEDADVSEKSIDIVKEIKELHAIMRAVQEDRAEKETGAAVTITFAESL